MCQPLRNQYIFQLRAGHQKENRPRQTKPHGGLNQTSDRHDCGLRTVDQGSWTQGRGLRTVDQGSWTQDRGPRIVDHGSWTQDHGARIVDSGHGPGIVDSRQWTKGLWTLDHGPRIMDSGLWTRDHGPTPQDRGSRTEHQGTSTVESKPGIFRN
ncbi:uncharacterized protein LOC144638872 [Oculina patagonica]